MTSSDQEASDFLAAFVATRATGRRWWADGVFLGGSGPTNATYAIALVDPEERFPRERDVTLHVPLASWGATDAITGEP